MEPTQRSPSGSPSTEAGEPGVPSQLGGFHVIKRLASGGTSDIFLARAEGPNGLERVVALKVLLERFRKDPAFERMFAREAHAYGRLAHPAIVKLHDFFSADGQLVMVLEYVDGLPLNKLRAMLSIAGEKLDDRAALFIGARLFSAIAAAHDAKDPETGELAPVIHRDINPSNVLIPWDGHVKLTDFGIAKVTGVQGDTKSGFIKGTYGYMAPEQVRGEDVTVRADVYAGSLILWELLTRRKAIQRGALPEVEVLKAMAKPQFPSIDTLRPDVDPKLREAIRRGLEPNADRRAITADEMVAVLRGAVKGDEARSLLVTSLARVRPEPASHDLPARMDGTFQTIATSGPSGRSSNPSDADETSRYPTIAGFLSKLEEGRMPGTLRDPHSPEGSEPPPTVDGTSHAPPGRGLHLDEPERSYTPAPPNTLPLPVAPPDSRPAGIGFVKEDKVARPKTLRFGPAVGAVTPGPPRPETKRASGPAPLVRTLVSPGGLAVDPAVRPAPPPDARVEVAPGPVIVAKPAEPPPPVVAAPAVRPVSPFATEVMAVAQPAPPVFRKPEPALFAPPPFPAPRRARGGAVWILVVLGVVVAGAWAGVWLTQRSSTPAVAASPQRSPASVVVHDVPPTPLRSASSLPIDAGVSASQAASAPPPRPAIPATTGNVVASSRAAGHRVFIDGRVAGQGPGSFLVKCGRHTVRVGSSGASQRVDVPCGGAVNVGP